jgi:hypothetical protein
LPRTSADIGWPEGQPWSLRWAAGLFRTVADGLVAARGRTKLRLRLGCVASV